MIFLNVLMLVIQIQDIMILLSEQNDALYPSRGTKRNDMGAFGGPNSKWDQMSIIPADTTGATGIENYYFNLPKSFDLSQNYPNPFNPETTIKYSLPSNVKSETENVKLLIYDVLGKEVITIVNQKQKPGNYKVTWDASNQTSGVYFYKLEIGDPESSSGQVFVKTKKMMLIK